MNIRSITTFIDPQQTGETQSLRQAQAFAGAARQAMQKAGYDVQTIRLATPPFPELVTPLEESRLVGWAVHMESAARQAGYDYLSIGPAPASMPEQFSLIPAVLAATQNVFAGAQIAGRKQGVSLPAVRACAAVIRRAASISPDGFANLRFAALANVRPGAPFFPAAYHRPPGAAFAMALEAAELAVAATQSATSLQQAEELLVESIEHEAQRLTAVAQELEKAHGVRFGGLDFSFAPYPHESRSIGKALENIGVPSVGLHGSLAAVAFLTSAIDRAQFRRAGFNGIFLPILEDSILAERAANGQLTVKDLLLYSAMCGTGLDTIPLAGDTPEATLAAILLDVAALALRLDKPLTARLMPIPGKKAGDPTEFAFEYFANSHVLPVAAAPLSSLLAGDETFNIHPRNPRGIT